MSLFFLAQPKAYPATDPAAFHCPQAFTSDAACPELGQRFQQARRDAQALCGERYRAPDSQSAELLGSSLALSRGFCATPAQAQTCHVELGRVETPQMDLLGSDVVNVARSELLRKIDQLKSTYSLLSSNAGPTPECRRILVALRNEISRAQELQLCPSTQLLAQSQANDGSSAQTRNSPHLGIASLPKPPALDPSRQTTQSTGERTHSDVLLRSTPTVQSETPPAPIPAQIAAPTQPAAADTDRTPSEPEAPAPRTPDERAVASAPGAPALTPVTAPATNTTPDPARSSAIFPSHTEWPPRCAMDAMTADIRKQMAEHGERSLIGRGLSSLLGGGPPENAQHALDYPETVFDTLPVEEQGRYLQGCITPEMRRSLQASFASSVRPPQCALDSMAREIQRLQQVDHERNWVGRTLNRIIGDSAPHNSEEILTSPDMGFLQMSASDRQRYMADCPPDQLMREIEASLTTPPRPPQCALDALTREITRVTQVHEERNWLSQSIRETIGDGPPENAAEILAHPEVTFSQLNDPDRLRFLAACSPDELRLALGSSARDPSAPPTPEALNALLTAGTATPGAAQNPNDPAAAAQNPTRRWPPQCALDAITSETRETQQAQQSRGLISRTWNWMLGDGTPSNADQLLRNPLSSFLSMDRATQERYLGKCSPEELNTQLNGNRDPLQGVTPPQCAVEAMGSDVRRLQQEASQQNWLERIWNRQWGEAPPRNAEQVLADPNAAYSQLSRDDQVRFLYECSPSWVRCTGGEHPGFFGRLRSRIQNMGFLGKTLFVLGSALAGAVLWRIRGGFLPTGSTQLARLIGTLPLALLGGLTMGPGGFLAGMSMFGTTAAMGWGKFFHMSNWKDILKMALRGLWQTAIPGALGVLAGASPFYMIAGVGMAGTYYLGNRVFPGLRIFPRAHFMDGPIPISEVFTGALLYGAFALSAFNGGQHAITPGGNCPGNLNSQTAVSQSISRF